MIPENAGSGKTCNCEVLQPADVAVQLLFRLFEI